MLFKINKNKIYIKSLFEVSGEWLSLFKGLKIKLFDILGLCN